MIGSSDDFTKFYSTNLRIFLVMFILDWNQIIQNNAVITLYFYKKDTLQHFEIRETGFVVSVFLARCINSIRSNVWSIRIWTTHNLSLWLYEYFWIILLYGHQVCILHFKGLGMRNLQYEMRICQKSHNRVTKTVYVWFEYL